jgi:hypothetical protein
LIDLAAVALEFQMGEVEPAGEKDLYGKIVTYIDRNYEDPELCLDVASRVIMYPFVAGHFSGQGK